MYNVILRSIEEEKLVLKERLKTGPPINPQKQKRGDIAQLRRTSNDGTMRNALPSNSRLKWDYIKDYDGKFVIPYVIAGHYEKGEKKIISEAMKKIDKNTCLRFKLRSQEKDYIEIQNKEGEGCYSTVGRYGGKSVLMLEASRIGSCIQPEVVIHELLHVIGLWHEHMREDRDKYITVHYENIQKGYENQFAKVLSPDAVTYGVPYDYLSIMHYEKNAFASPRTISMEPLDRRYLDLIGKQKEPSRNDYLKVCYIYSCSVCMGQKIRLTTTERPTKKPHSPTQTTRPYSTRGYVPVGKNQAVKKHLVAHYILGYSYGILSKALDKRPSKRRNGKLPRRGRINLHHSRSGRIDKYCSLLQYEKQEYYYSHRMMRRRYCWTILKHRTPSWPTAVLLCCI
ncbi:hypothetical protein Y032_0189g1200 [Ancylostoma ceylanicum]|uniref:Metalloendopeptidase n=1 Tax=Ancylostoma ceylanicum TaxID=53326 RepID=A0A016SR63_9BILA|nr:hypothetical protein Y032_0189g1200 [Ancylostoma ceylanicum]